MIDIIKTPIEGTVLFNNSPIEIIVESTRGANYYFRLAVIVDGAEYDFQQHSKINDVRCIIDFKNDVSGVFVNPYVSPPLIGIIPLHELKKEVRLIVREYEKGTNTQVDELELFPFYLVNANNNTDLVLNKLTPLSVYDSFLKIDKTGVITFPFFANQDVTGKLIVNGNTFIHFTHPTAGEVLSFNVDFTTHGLTSTDHIEMIISDTNGGNEFSRIIEIRDLNIYDVTPIAFQNNFNAWEHFYCFGEKETKPTYKRHVLKQTESENYPFKVSRTDKFKINTGFFAAEYYKAIGKLIESLNFVYFENSLSVKAELLTKKEVNHKTKTHYYSQDLELKRNEPVMPDIGVQYISPPSLVNIYASADENIPLEIPKSEFEAAFSGANPHTLRFPILNTTGTIHIVINGASTLLDDTVAYVFADFEKIILTGPGYGDPYTTCRFNMENSAGLSNTATIFFKRRMYDPLNMPPVISLPSEVLVLIDVPSKSIVATITEPDNDPYTIIWQQIGGGIITMQETDTNSLLLSNWVGAGVYDFQITATDDHGNSATAITKLIVMNLSINLGATDDNLIIYKGVEGETVDIEIIHDPLPKYIGTSFSPVDIKLHNTSIASVYKTNGDDFASSAPYTYSVQHTFPIDGVLSLPVTKSAGLTFPLHIAIGFKITSVSGAQTKGYNSAIYMKFKL